ncbi:MAG: VWA domain-containing protein [Chloroflexaceae bacterium]|nr:VWA domain-containing protein [Chloroflexaceae bacterium]
MGCELHGDDVAIDRAVTALYGDDKEHMRVGMGKSRPNVVRWLDDIRTYFPTSVVRVMQQDALERLNLKQMLLEPELLESIEPDVHLVGTLLALKNVMPAQTRATARIVVNRVVEELQRKLANPTRQAVLGSLNRAIRNRRPRHNEIDWHRTIRANLQHYQPNYRTIIPVNRIGYGRKRSAMRDIILCVDQSGSMATSVVYAGIFGAVLASLPALKMHMVVYDTAVVDLTADLSDPVELLFGTQLGGGNDTPRALLYCQQLVSRPTDTILVLISDLYEGAGEARMIELLGELAGAGVQVVVLLALSDSGAPSYSHSAAAKIANLGIAVFACTPDLFPDMMAAAINRQDITQWAAVYDIVTVRGTT